MSKTFIFALTALLCCSGCATKKFMFKPSAQASAQAIEKQFSIARLMERSGDEDNAAKVYHKILDEDPQCGEAHHRLAVMAAQNQQIDKALEHFSAAEETMAPDADLLCDFGYLHYLTGNLAAAEQKLVAALQVDSKHESALNNLGMVYGQQEKWAESFEQFRLANGHAKAYSNVAFLQVQAGALQEAQANYLRALDLDNSLRSAAEALLQFPKDLPEVMQQQEQIAEAQQPNARQADTPRPVDAPAGAVVQVPVEVAEPKVVPMFQQADYEHQPGNYFGAPTSMNIESPSEAFGRTLISD